MSQQVKVDEFKDTVSDDGGSSSYGGDHSAPTTLAPQRSASFTTLAGSQGVQLAFDPNQDFSQIQKKGSFVNLPTSSQKSHVSRKSTFSFKKIK